MVSCDVKDCTFADFIEGAQEASPKHQRKEAKPTTKTIKRSKNIALSSIFFLTRSTLGERIKPPCIGKKLVTLWSRHNIFEEEFDVCCSRVEAAVSNKSEGSRLRAHGKY